MAWMAADQSSGVDAHRARGRVGSCGGRLRNSERMDRSVPCGVCRSSERIMRADNVPGCGREEEGVWVNKVGRRAFGEG